MIYPILFKWLKTAVLTYLQYRKFLFFFVIQHISKLFYQLFLL